MDAGRRRDRKESTPFSGEPASKLANRDIWLDIFRAVTLNDNEVGGRLDESIVRAHQDASDGRLRNRL